MNELSDDEYVALGVLPMSKFPSGMRENINAAVLSRRPPRKMWPPRHVRAFARCASREWFEWHIRRGRDPRQAREYTPAWLRDAVIERDGMVCALCSLPIPGRSELHIDHRKPVARGGRTTLDNLQPTHSVCNLRKGAEWNE